MVRKKIKKRKIRRNPYVDDNYIDLLIGALISTSVRELDKANVYYNQGSYCNDCDKSYLLCECEKCDECGFNRCLCDLDITSKLEIRKKIWSVAKKTLNDKQLESIYSILKKEDPFWRPSKFIEKIIETSGKANILREIDL